MIKLVIFVAFIGYASAVDGDAHAEIKSYKNEIEPDGSYAYSYETSNGIAMQEAGNEHGAHGSFEYISHEGHPYKITYDADKLGYYPKGEHLPANLLRTLEYLRAHADESDTKSQYKSSSDEKKE